MENTHLDEDVQVIQVDSSALEMQNRAEIDMQISTAKKYPRDLKRTQQNAIKIVTMDEDTAKSCKYTLRRAGKEISGPTVHLAKIILSQYGNIRASARVISNDGKMITSQGVCHDLENNVWVGIEVKRRITDRDGKTFSDDMQTVTGNASNAIALRNAVYAVVPRSIIDTVFKAAERKLLGDLTDQDKFLLKRAKVFEGFKDTYGLSEERVLAAVGIKAITALKPEQLVQLIGIAQALLDGETTVEESFPLTQAEQTGKFEQKLKEQQEKQAKKETAKETKAGEQTTIV